MKNFAKLIKLTLIATTLVTMFSCSDDDTVVTPINNSIVGVASRNSQFSTLVTALDKAGLVQTLDQNGPFTVFAPTNDAFEDFLSDNGFANLDAVPVATLKEILLNHVVMGTNLSSSLSTGYVKSLGKGEASSTNTLSLFINKTTNVKINGVATVTSADILATNGVIHQVDTVLGLANIADHAVANPALSTLTNLLSQQSLVPVLSGQTNAPFTVFAPSNTAFTTFENENPGTLASLTSEQVTSVLTYHVISGANVLSNAIPSGPITTLESGTLSITGTTITDEVSRETQIETSLVDIQTSNGIIHVINNVILPQL